MIEGLPGTQFKSPGFGTHSPSCCAHCSHCTNPCQWHNCGSDFFLLTYKQTQDQVYRANITASHFCKEKNSAWHRCRNRRGGWGHPPSPTQYLLEGGSAPPSRGLAFYCYSVSRSYLAVTITALQVLGTVATSAIANHFCATVWKNKPLSRESAMRYMVYTYTRGIYCGFSSSRARQPTSSAPPQSEIAFYG